MKSKMCSFIITKAASHGKTRIYWIYLMHARSTAAVLNVPLKFRLHAGHSLHQEWTKAPYSG